MCPGGSQAAGAVVARSWRGRGAVMGRSWRGLGAVVCGTVRCGGAALLSWRGRVQRRCGGAGWCVCGRRTGVAPSLPVTPGLRREFGTTNMVKLFRRTTNHGYGQGGLPFPRFRLGMGRCARARPRPLRPGVCPGGGGGTRVSLKHAVNPAFRDPHDEDHRFGGPAGEQCGVETPVNSRNL